MRNEKKQNHLGEVLVTVGVITKNQMLSAVKDAEETEKDLSDILINKGIVTEAQIIKAIGYNSKIPYFENLDGLISPDSAKIIPEELSRMHQTVALFKQGGSVMLAMVNPYDIYALDDISRHTGLKVDPVISTRKTIFSAISRIYAKSDQERIETEIQKATDDVGEQKEYNQYEVVDYSALADASALENATKAPIIKLVDRIIFQAINQKASDIHIEPKTKNMIVRYRLDGMLHEVMDVPRNIAAAVTSRVKIMAKLDITENRRPQDGRIQIKMDDRNIDLRISILPMVTGEKTVIRILDKQSTALNLDSLGMPPDLKENFRKIISYPTGIMLVTGPTGSGKTTTLYSALHLLMDKTKNITTLEDPVEFQFDGINQVQVNSKIDMTFAVGLRSILRQDPDILLVGEIRDSETASIAINAALTGHMVLATLHTNDACGGLSRLIDMGVEPFLLNSALTGILAQRLVRVLCPDCREPYTPEQALLKELKISGRESYTFYRSRGCKKCAGTGYTGRVGIFEFLEMTKEVKDRIIEKDSYNALLEAARKGGFLNMLERSTEKIIKGITSAEEVLRVTRSD